VSGTLNETRFVLRDYLDPIAIITAAGVVDERYGYEAFGPVRVMDANFATRSSSTCAWNWLYHGEFLDGESGMYDYGYRFYHPALGRWASRDPIGERGGVNLYGFVGNGVSEDIDKYGLAKDCKKVLLLAGPNYNKPNLTSSSISKGKPVGQELGLPAGVQLYTGSHGWGLTSESVQGYLDAALEKWEEQNKKKCCHCFKGGLIGSSEAAPMTAERARNLIDEYLGKVDLLMLMAHGMVESGENETGLVFHVGSVGALKTPVGRGFKLSEVVPQEADGDISILACNDKKMPNSAGKLKVHKIGANVDGANYVAALGPYVERYVFKVCDACK
jgi:RHS repeat-associated protein